MHDVDVHWLELETVTGEDDIAQAKLLELFESAVQLHDVDVHWLEFAMVTEEEYV